MEVADQVEGLTWLASQYSFIDMSRVAIHGWSYGRFCMILLARLCQFHPRVVCLISEGVNHVLCTR